MTTRVTFSGTEQSVQALALIWDAIMIFDDNPAPEWMSDRYQQEPIVQWCSKHAPDRHRISIESVPVYPLEIKTSIPHRVLSSYVIHFDFDRESDAVLFKLTWK